MSITNNEVKFLVSLDIDKDKSKKRIDTFLSKEMKDKKLTFGVNVGASNKNIKTFLDKHKNKNINLSFDVAVGQSKANIQTFLNNQKQAKKSLIFYVNEQATQTTVKSALKKIEVQPLQISFGVNYQQSKANINKFIETVKVNQKPIELILEKKASVQNINKSLEQIIFAKVKVKLELAKGAFNHIKDTVETKELQGLKTVMELDVEKTKLRISEQINKMSLPKFKIDVVANVTPVVSSKAVQATVKEAPSNVKEIPSPPTDFNGTIGALKELRSILVDINTKVTDLKKNTSEDTNLGKGVSDFSAKVIELGQAITSPIEAYSKLKEENNEATEASNKASKAANLLSFAFGGLGAAGMIAGTAIQLLTARYEEAKKAKEELRAKNEQEVKSFADNEKAIDSLLSKYSKLSSNSDNLNSKEYNELLDTQNKIAKLLPDLKKGEDEFGNSIIVSSQEAQTKVEILKQELEIQKKINAEKLKAEQKESEDTARDTIEDANKNSDIKLRKAYQKIYKMEYLNSQLEGNFLNGLKTGEDGFGQNTLKNLEEVSKAIEKINNALNHKTEDNLSDRSVKQLTNTKDYLQSIQLELLQGQQDVLTGMNVFKTGYTTKLDEVIKTSYGFSKEGQEAFEDVAKSVINLSKSEKGLEKFNDVVTYALNNKDSTLVQNFDDLAKEITKMKNSTTTDVKQVDAEFKEFGESTKKLKGDILKNLVDSGIKKGSAQYNDWAQVLDNVIVKETEHNNAIIEIMKSQGKSQEEARKLVIANGGLVDEIDKEIEKLQELNSASEKIVGVSQAQTDKVDDLIFIYSQLSAKTNLTAQETKTLKETFNTLNKLYPLLTRNNEVRTDMIGLENEAVKALLEGYELSKKGILNEEEKHTLQQGNEAFARIGNLKAEAEAIAEIQKQYQKTNQLSSEQISYLIDKGVLKSTGHSMWLPTMETPDIGEQIDAYLDETSSKITGLMGEVKTSTDSLNSSLSTAKKREEERAKATKESTKEISELDRITKKYALTLDKINTSLKEVESRQKKYPTYSKQYRQALADENRLIQQQNDLLNQKLKDLSGVQGTSSGSSYTTFENVTPKGWSGKITSNWATRADNHKGIDIDGAIGDLLQSNVKGKVVAKGSDSVSGNYVYVMDSNGLKHFYAHLDSIAVAIGDVVDVGTKLGTIGNTGNVVKGKGGDGSHLHYGVKQGNTWIDPTSYAQSARSGVQTYSQTKASSVSSGSSAQATVWNFFKSKGLSDSAVAGIMGNIQQESSFSSTAGRNAEGSAFGIAQWRGSRLSELNSFAKSKGTSANDLGTQLDFMWKELQGKEKQALHSLNRTLTATEHASNFNILYERSGEKAGSKGHNNRVNYANNAYNTHAGSGATAGGGSGNDDYARAQSESESIRQTIMANNDRMQENDFQAIKSQMESYKRNRDIEDLGIAKQAELQKNMLEYNKEYENSVNKQYTAEQRKLKSYQDEYAYIQKMYDLGGLTDIQQDELLDKRLEIQQQMLESQNQIKEYYNQIISGKLAGFDKKMDDYSKTLEWEEVKIQSLDRTSERYRKTLEIMANTRQGQIKTSKAELDYINKVLSKGNLTIEMYQELTQRADELKKGLVELNEALHQTNYEMVQAVIIASNTRIDDIDFELNYNQALRGLYEEGSGDYLKTLEDDMELLQKKLIEIKEQEFNTKDKMKGMDLGTKELEDLEEQLEANALAYLEVQKAVKDTQEAIDNFTQSIDDKVKEMREKLANDIIDALKDAINEAKDIQMDALDKLIEAEEKRHEKVMKQYDKELEAYTKIIDAKRREIADSDRDRTHGNKLEELNTQKQELQNKLNLLSNVNTYEGIKEKEELQKQIAEIEKQINEEKYQYEKDLREQQLDDLLDEKTEHIDDLKEKEDEYSKDVLESLNKQKKYWEKYYADLLNDEKYFAKMREDILAGNFAEVEAKFAEHIKLLTDSLPDLQDTFDGTMKAVGATIRQNVIDKMKELSKEIEKVEKEVRKVEALKKKVTGDYGKSDANQTVENAGKKEALSEADLKVILAKFMNEEIAGKLNPQTDAVRIKNIKDKANKLASEGRKEDSKINANQSLGSLFDSMSKEQLSQVGGYFDKNASNSGFSTQEYLDYIKEFGQTAEKGKVMTHGDKQVMLAKYMKEYLMPRANTKAKKDAINGTATKIADSGRKHTSLISPNVSYDQSLSKLSGKQQAELGQFMLDNTSAVNFTELKDMLISYASNLRLNQSNDFIGSPASMDVGGMTKGFGSTGGSDGKGGRLALLHQNEIVSNPLDTERMLRISSIMDNIMRTINGAIALPTQPKVSTVSTPTSTDNSTVVHVNIDKFNGTKSDIDKLGDQIKNRLLREKGKR
ncbi:MULTISPECIES: phage tail tip lysozyme [unclassified Lysinibacillus]|uniref:phage tail tip lysozyme n=1 Tax=unclassified Lysinibacillus TaxID=2636778 RepID=UPI00380ED546